MDNLILTQSFALIIAPYTIYILILKSLIKQFKCRTTESTSRSFYSPVMTFNPPSVPYGRVSLSPSNEPRNYYTIIKLKDHKTKRKPKRFSNPRSAIIQDTCYYFLILSL